MSQKVLLVDGNSLIHRAFHATPPMTTTRGELTNAVFAFARMLFRALNTLKPEYAVIAFDRAAPTFRHLEFDAYKAHRAPAPEGLYEQFGRVHELVDVLSLQTCEVDGFEADDVLATLASQAVGHGLDVVIMTGDTDALQLVNEHVSVWMPRKGMSDTILYDSNGVRERYGLEPNQLIDFKALKGDPSDNIPGVPGIGEKTASRLLAKFGTIDQLVTHVNEIEPRLARSLTESADQLVQTRRLITIVNTAPIQIDLEKARVGTYDADQLSAFLRELEFRIPANELPGRRTVTTAPGQLALFEDANAPVAAPAIANDAAAAAVAGQAPTECHVVTVDELPTLVKRLRAAGTISLDVETTDTDAMRAELVGISVSDQPGRGWYIPVGHRSSPANVPIDVALDLLRPVLADSTIQKVGHNLKYDAMVLERAGAPVEGISFDTMIARYLLQSSERALNLKDVAYFELGIPMTPIVDLIGKGKNQISMADVPVEQAAPYACADADIAFRLTHRFADQLKSVGLWDLFTRVEMPLLSVLARMEEAGVAIDVPYLKGMSANLAEKIGILEGQIYAEANHPFNINSTQQLAKVLFDELGLPTSRRTQSGYSTDADTLEELRPRHPIVGLILDYRQLIKLKSTYVDALPLMINPYTGRVHTSFNQTGASTGRLSSSEPNLQNIPIRTDLGKQVRRAFVARPGSLLFAADYSQVELRILAHVTQDPNLVEAFASGRDIHAATASQILGVPLAEVSSDQRRMAKTVNFGVLYGMGDYGLATQLGVSRADAHSFIEHYFAQFPTVAAYLEETKRQAREQGYVTTLLGRRRYIAEINTPNRQIRSAAERTAINMPIQGTAADIIKVAMIRIDGALRERNFATQMILQVHDELVFDVPENELAIVRPLVVELMENAFPMTVPLRVEGHVGPNWSALD